jgi:hypothetical protein
MRYNNKLVEAIIALQNLQEWDLFGIYSNKKTVERCIRWLDAMVPPPTEDNSKSE